MGSKGTEATKLDHWIDRILWGLLCGVCVYAAQQVHDLSNNVVDLKIELGANRVAVEGLKSGLSDHENRIRALEGAERTPARGR